MLAADQVGGSDRWCQTLWAWSLCARDWSWVVCCQFATPSILARDKAQPLWLVSDRRSKMPPLFWSGKLALPMRLLIDVNSLLSLMVETGNSPSEMKGCLRRGYVGEFSDQVRQYDELGYQLQDLSTQLSSASTSELSWDTGLNGGLGRSSKFGACWKTPVSRGSKASERYGATISKMAGQPATSAQLSRRQGGIRGSRQPREWKTQNEPKAASRRRFTSSRMMSSLHLDIC